DEFALTLAPAADDAADARGEFAPVDRARHDVGGAGLEGQYLLDQVGAAGDPDEARTRLAGVAAQQIETTAGGTVSADAGDVAAAARKQRLGQPLLFRLAHLVAAAFAIVGKAVVRILPQADERDNRPCTHASNHCL